MRKSQDSNYGEKSTTRFSKITILKKKKKLFHFKWTRTPRKGFDAWKATKRFSVITHEKVKTLSCSRFSAQSALESLTEYVLLSHEIYQMLITLSLLRSWHPLPRSSSRHRVSVRAEAAALFSAAEVSRRKTERGFLEEEHRQISLIRLFTDSYSATAIVTSFVEEAEKVER